jgi:hypothetical protein
MFAEDAKRGLDRPAGSRVVPHPGALLDLLDECLLVHVYLRIE